MVFTELPFELVEIDKNVQNSQLQSSLYACDGYRLRPKNYFVSPAYKNHGLDIYNFEAREDDVYLVGFPRSGTTMHCEMIWLIGNNLDYKMAQEKILDTRFPHIDPNLLSSSVMELNRSTAFTLDDLKNQKEQRFIKAHLPLSLLPPSIFVAGSKVIYCARDPRDMIVSYFHILNFFQRDGIVEDFAYFFKAFKYSWNYFTPYFEHVKEAWAKRNDENFLFLFYEDTMKNQKQTILKVAELLNKNLTDAEVDGLLDHLSVDKFRKNKSVNLDHLKEAGLINKHEDFIRKGKPGGWRDYFVGDLAKEVDEWMAENMKDTDLKFPES